MNWQKILDQTTAVVERAAEFIHSEFGNVARTDILTKSQNSLVSYVDQTAERMLVEGLREVLPGSTFLTEEETVNQERGAYQWIIDPLDGTTNFLHGLPHFAVSVALRHHRDLVVGVVYDVTKREVFTAYRGGGAWLNGQKIGVSSNDRLSDALIATGFPYYDYSRVKQFHQTLERFMREARGVRRFGAAALDLAWVACGRYDFFFEYSLHAWDMAAGILLVEEAGGKVTDYVGGNDSLVRGDVMAGSSQIFGHGERIVMDDLTKN